MTSSTLRTWTVRRDQVQQGREKLIGTAIEAEAERRWEDALVARGRNQGPYALDAWWAVLSIAEKRELVLDVWEGAEWPCWPSTETMDRHVQGDEVSQRRPGTTLGAGRDMARCDRGDEGPRHVLVSGS